jgi:hypothetical protein
VAAITSAAKLTLSVAAEPALLILMFVSFVCDGVKQTESANRWENPSVYQKFSRKKGRIPRDWNPPSDL